MKARTKNQKRVVKIHNKKKPIGKRLVKWATKNILTKRGVRSKAGTINCLECGHHWKSDMHSAWHDEILDIECPSCKCTLEIKASNKTVFDDEAYFTQITTVNEYQLVRTFIIYADYKTKHKVKHHITECFNIYIREDGKREIIGPVKGGMFYSTSGWSGFWELRNPNAIDSKYSEEGAIYPIRKIQDWALQKGFNDYALENVNYIVQASLSTLCIYSEAETVLKADWLKLFDYCCRNIENVKKYWPTIRICIRNGYSPIDVNSYFDMLDALEYFNKDLRNSVLVCPENFTESHDNWIRWKHNRQRRIRDEEIRKNKIEALKKLKAQRAAYPRRMKKFKNLKWVHGDLVVVPMMKLDDVQKAGNILHHCIYLTERYWTDPDNLLFATYESGRLIETTQFKIAKNFINHSWGLDNKESRHHKTILNIIEKNKREIYACLKPKIKKKDKNLIAS